MAKITIMFGADPQGERSLDRPELKIGRAADCEIVVDNLGVSRHHCTIVQEGPNWVLVDGGSNNGTFINGQKVQRHTLKHMDKIVLGKHSLIFDQHGYAQLANEEPRKTTGGGMGGEVTMFVDQAAMAKMAKDGGAKRMAISLKQGGRDVVFPLVKEEVTIGKSNEADLPAHGMFVKPIQAKILKASSGYRLIAGGGMRSVRVNGQKVTDAVLKVGDIIVIAGQSYTFKQA
jgi:pSer/pThr/pTyr-binding forkhead associated (FHA) protein